MAHTLNGDILKHCHLVFTQRTCGRNNDTFTCVDTKGIKVLHTSNGEATIVGITDNLELDFLPALQTFLHKYLGSKGECALGNLQESLLVLTNTATKTTQSVSATDHNGIAQTTCCSYGIFYIVASLTHGRLHVYLVQLLDKQIAVLCVHDCFNTCTQHLYTILLQSTIQI